MAPDRRRCGRMDQQDRQLGRKSSGEALGFDTVRAAIYKRIKAVAAFPVVFALGAASIVLLLPETYEATATVQIDPRQRAHHLAEPGASEIEAQRQTIEAELRVLQSEPVLRRAADALHLDQDPEFSFAAPVAWLYRLAGRTPESQAEASIARRVSISRLRNTLLVNIRVSTRDAQKSARIANAIAESYLADWSDGRASAETAATMMGQRDKDDFDGDGKITESERMFGALLAQNRQSLEVPGPSLAARAVPPSDATAARPLRAGAFGFALALAAALSTAVLLELKSSTRSAHVAAALACPHTTSLPPLPAHGTTPAHACRFILSEPSGTYADAVRETCRELEKRRGGAASRVTLVASALPDEGAECLASNIAHQYAVAGHSVLLVDADLRTGSLTRRLAGASTAGLLDQIASRKPVENAILRDGATGLHFLPACGSSLVPIPVHDLLRSRAFADALAGLRENFVTIILSAPPLLASGDAAILADLVDDIVFATAWQKTPKRLARKALAALSAHQGKLVGAALTDVAGREDGSIMSLREILEEMRTSAPQVGSRPRAA